MSDASQITAVVSFACLLGAAIWCGYDIARRRLSGMQRIELDSLSNRISDLARHHEQAIIDACKKVDDLREDNKAEFLAMKQAFDRFSTKQAIAETMGVDPRNARQFG